MKEHHNLSKLLDNFPRAALLCLGFCLLTSLACLVACRLRVDADKKVMLLVGDSFTGNYRFAKGERLEDMFNADPASGRQAFNFAHAGARTLDMLMLIGKGRMLLGRVDMVVLPLFVDKFMISDDYIRLDKRGDDLKWLDLGASTADLRAEFDREMWKKLVIHKAGLLTGVYDLGEQLYIDYIQSPMERADMLNESPQRRAKIIEKTKATGERWDKTDITAEWYKNNQAARDLSLAVDYARKEGIPLLAVLIPAGNPEAAAELFSERAQSNLELVRRATAGWCRERNLPVVDLVEVMPGRCYDDFPHIKSPECNRLTVDAVNEKLKELGW